MKNKRKSGKNLLYGLLFSSPAIIGFSVFVLVPMLSSLVLGFTKYGIASSPKFIGLHNYIHIFDGEDPFFYKSITVTFYYVCLYVPLSLIVAFALALLLNRIKRGKSLFRTIFYLPSIVPLIATSMIWLWIFNPNYGLANNILQMLGLPEGKWFFSTTTVIPTLVFMNLWTTGGIMVIFLAGLQGVPRHLYESIEIDGGNSWRKLINVTIPYMTPTIFFNLVMGIITAFQVFVEPYIITQGGPDNASLFYVYYLYREAFKYSKMGYACAIAWILFIIIALLTSIIFKTSRKWVYYEGES